MVCVCESPEDVRKAAELVRARFVMSDFATKHFILDIVDTEGKKDALSKSKQLESAIAHFCEGDAALVSKFGEKLKAGSGVPEINNFNSPS